MVYYRYEITFASKAGKIRRGKPHRFPVKIKRIIQFRRLDIFFVNTEIAVIEPNYIPFFIKIHISDIFSGFGLFGAIFVGCKYNITFASVVLCVGIPPHTFQDGQVFRAPDFIILLVDFKNPLRQPVGFEGRITIIRQFFEINRGRIQFIHIVAKGPFVANLPGLESYLIAVASALYN